MPAPFHFDRCFELRATPGRLWEALEQTGRFPSWWSWLRTLESTGLHEGAVAHCLVQAPLPYRLQLEIAVQRVVPHELVATRVRGDLVGPARLEIASRGSGCRARLVWSLELRPAVLRGLSRLARPAMVWAHDRVIEVGLREFERHALDGKGAP